MDIKICIPVNLPTQKEVLKRIKKAEKHANIVEVDLSAIRDLDLPFLLRQVNLPVMVVYKKASEGGYFKGSYEDMANRLIEAMKAGVEYLEIPFKMNERWMKKILNERKKYPTCKLISCYENKEKTPSFDFLLKKAGLMKSKGVNVVKIVTFAKDRNDAIKMVAFSKMLKGKKIPHIVWASGKHGRLSQLLTPTIGSEMMWAALDKKEEVSTNLLSAKTLWEGWSCFNSQ